MDFYSWQETASIYHPSWYWRKNISKTNMLNRISLVLTIVDNQSAKDKKRMKDTAKPVYNNHLWNP